MGLLQNTSALLVLTALCASQPVEQPPVLSEVPESALFTVFEPAQTLTLPCSTTSRVSKVKYTWKKNGQPFDLKSQSGITTRDNEGTIVFQKPHDGDEGVYQCFAESEIGVASTRPITVKKAYINAPKVSVQKHKPIEGQPFKLDCSFDAYPQPTIEWKLQSKNDPNKFEKVDDGRITISPEGTLWFSNITKADTHTDYKYVCLASSPATPAPVTLAEHYIEDVVPNNGKDYSEVVEQYSSKDMTVKVGDVTTLYCIFGGSPLAHPDWFKDGKDVNNSPKDRITRYNHSKGKRLLIRETWLEDQGTYTCTVDNEVGKPKQHSMHLTVVSRPTYAKKPQPHMSAKQGQEVFIPCEVLGVPTPKITWTYNARPLPEGIHVHSSSSGNRTVADLHFSSVKKSDTGYYGCKAANEHGDVYSETLFVVA